MSDDELARIEALANAATAGPWKLNPLRRLQLGLMEQDADFIASSRSAVPALVAEVRRLRAALEDVELEACCETPDASHIVATIRNALTPPANSPPPACG